MKSLIVAIVSLFFGAALFVVGCGSVDDRRAPATEVGKAEQATNPNCVSYADDVSDTNSARVRCRWTCPTHPLNYGTPGTAYYNVVATSTADYSYVNEVNAGSTTGSALFQVADGCYHCQVEIAGPVVVDEPSGTICVAKCPEWGCG